MLFTSKEDYFSLLSTNLELTKRELLPSYSFRHNNTWSLTTDGCLLMSQLYQHHSFNLEEGLLMKHKIILSRYAEAPYYYDKKKQLILFDCKAAFIITLHGDIMHWINSLNQ